MEGCQPPVIVWINSCVAKWNISSYDYDVIVSWTVNGSSSLIAEFSVSWFETDLAGITPDSGMITPAKQNIVSCP